METELDYVRYLRSKETVDRRSINTHVFDTFNRKLHGILKAHGKIHILDVGAGLGSSFRRIHESIVSGRIDYTIIDIEEAHVTTARSEVVRWLRGKGYTVQQKSSDQFHVKDGGIEVNCQFVTGDALAFASESPQSFDALVGQAFLDIIPLESGLKALFKALKPGGVFYFPINFDGISALLPVVDPPRERRVEDIFHRSMDERNGGRTGGSQTGRQLLEVLPSVGARIDAVGASDWIVRPRPASDSYPDDEEYFLRCILEFMHGELSKSRDMSAKEIESWHNQRLNQLRSGELKYIAHQLDYTGEFVGI